jgi:hypothetical protein
VRGVFYSRQAGSDEKKTEGVISDLIYLSFSHPNAQKKEREGDRGANRRTKLWLSRCMADKNRSMAALHIPLDFSEGMSNVKSI